MTQYHYREQTGTHENAPLFFVFHGTGGNENQFFDLAAQLLPGAHIISPRGDVSEGGALRFFRRTGEGVYDMDDFAIRTQQMIDFIAAQKAAGPGRRTVGLGYSNGANILANVQFHAPDLFGQTVLMHPLIPFVPPAAELVGKRVLLTAGQRDPMAPAEMTQRLANYFMENGASAELVWHSGGHELRQEELLAAQRFLAA